jgi:hypothetical protein
MSQQTGLRPLRRRLLTGMGALGASVFAPWILRPVRAASGESDGSAPDAGPAQRGANEPGPLPYATLYEEDRSDPKGRKFPGVAQWTLVEKAERSSGMLETSVRASVAIPERQMVMTFTLRPNNDKSLPATHTVEFLFALPADAPRTIGSVPGILMKAREDARGNPLQGYAVKVTDAYYLIGLSAVDTARAVNRAMLEKLEWFDVPIVYGDSHRAILAFQKGETGRHVFAQAFAAWGEPPRHAPPPAPPPKLQMPPDIIK